MTQPTIDLILKALKEIRVSLVDTEYTLQDIIKKQFDKYKINYIKEYSLGKRKRIDFFVDGIAIEVKKGKKRPNRTNVIKQLSRYSESDEVHTIIYVGEKSVFLPEEINNKTCISVVLAKNWGISL